MPLFRIHISLLARTDFTAVVGALDTVFQKLSETVLEHSGQFLQPKLCWMDWVWRDRKRPDQCPQHLEHGWWCRIMLTWRSFNICLGLHGARMDNASGSTCICLPGAALRQSTQIPMIIRRRGLTRSVSMSCRHLQETRGFVWRWHSAASSSAATSRRVAYFGQRRRARLGARMMLT